MQDRVSGKLGRGPVVHNRRSMRAALTMAKALDALGPAPAASADYLSAVRKATGGDWGMLGNDKYGCCVWSDSGHQLMLRTANVSRIVIPTEAEILVPYSAVTGFDGTAATDKGTNELDAMAYLRSTGLLGHKSDDFGTIDPTNPDHVKWAIQLFGGVRLGILVTPAMIQMFESHQPWAKSQPGGEGHDVPLVNYAGDWATAITWAGEQQVYIPLLADPAFCDEAHSELYFDWIAAQGLAPSRLNLAQLDADLKYIET